MKFFTVKELEELAAKADEYCERYDIPQEVYESIMAEQEEFFEFLEKNPDCYGNKADWEQAKVHNRFIYVVLLIRVNEMMGVYKTG